MKRLIVWIVLLAAAVVAAIYFLPGAGVAMLEFAGWRIETTAVGLVLMVLIVLIALQLLWRLIAGVVHLPARFSHRSAEQRRRAADEKLLRAWAERQRRQTELAQRYALAGVEDGSLPPMHFQVAIDALLDGLDPSRQGVAPRGRDETREEIGDLFETVGRRFPKFAEFLRLHIVQRLIALNEVEWAQAMVEPLIETHPRDEAILLIRAQLLELAGDFDALGRLLPTLRRIKDKRLTADELLRIERVVLLGRIEAASRVRDLDVLSRLWSEAGRNVVDNPGVTIAYAEALARGGAEAAAARVLEKRLGRSLEAQTLHAWAELRHEDPADARKRLLKLVPDDWSEPANAPDVGRARERAAFAYAMARLALAESDPSSAQLWVGRLGPLDQELRYLAVAARVHARLRDSSEAALLYERALTRAGLETSAAPQPVTPSAADNGR
ncbi:heme biosynthesis HemY N-terminal domain-containing protein [Guyparkeria sp. GHLCS8-2]|uniref:heme biosynthesis HemY N-terminal domain-containing protein n=1 Tax=Guyparkeria halopsychrophila TaxID=3139421 RepID=UPI0037C5B068